MSEEPSCMLMMNRLSQSRVKVKTAPKNCDVLACCHIRHRDKLFRDKPLMSPKRWKRVINVVYGGLIASNGLWCCYVLLCVCNKIIIINIIIHTLDTCKMKYIFHHTMSPLAWTQPTSASQQHHLAGPTDWSYDHGACLFFLWVNLQTWLDTCMLEFVVSFFIASHADS